MGREISKIRRHPAIAAATILNLLFGLAWPLGLIPGISYMIRYRELQVRNLPGVGQIRGLSGPFEALGIDAVIILAIIFAVMNLLFILAGYWLWKSKRKGGILTIILLGLSAIFWWGFSLPFPPIVGVLLAVLLSAGWKSLT